MNKTIAFEQSKEYRIGYNAESILAQILREEGYYTIFTADVKERGRNGAPGARSGSGFITLPDLDVGKNGYRGFVEVKYKYKADFTTITRRHEHGIGWNKFEMYRKAQQQFGCDVFLFIYEGKDGVILYNRLDILLPKRNYYIKRTGQFSFYFQERGERHSIARRYHGDKMDRGGMIFFPRASFSLWGKISQMEDVIYTQLDLFSTSRDEGDKLFQIIHHNTVL